MGPCWAAMLSTPLPVPLGFPGRLVKSISLSFSLCLSQDPGLLFRSALCHLLCDPWQVTFPL